MANPRQINGLGSTSLLKTASLSAEPFQVSNHCLPQFDHLAPASFGGNPQSHVRSLMPVFAWMPSCHLSPCFLCHTIYLTLPQMFIINIQQVFVEQTMQNLIFSLYLV